MIPFQTKQGIDSHFKMRGMGVQIELCQETRFSSRVGTGVSGNFLMYIKGVEYRFEFQEGTWDFLRRCSGKGTHLTLTGESLGFPQDLEASLGFFSS